MFRRNALTRLCQIRLHLRVRSALLNNKVISRPHHLVECSLQITPLQCVRSSDVSSSAGQCNVGQFLSDAVGGPPRLPAHTSVLVFASRGHKLMFLHGSWLLGISPTTRWLAGSDHHNVAADVPLPRPGSPPALCVVGSRGARSQPTNDDTLRPPE